jgi:hypothetical protein
MTKAREYLTGQSTPKLENTAKCECYEYTCEKNDATYFVEMKGTQTQRTSIILTRND